MWRGRGEETVNNVAGLKLAKERCVCVCVWGGGLLKETVNNVAGLKLAQEVCVWVGGGEETVNNVAGLKLA